MIAAGRYQLVNKLDKHDDFLFYLYSQTFGRQFLQAGIPDDLVATLLLQQFAFKEDGYQNDFPDAAHAIIELSGNSVGQLRINRTDCEIRIVDISVAPDHQGKGVATTIIQKLLEAGERENRVVCLQVERGSPAQVWYQKLGFSVVKEAEVYASMVHNPGSTMEYESC